MNPRRRDMQMESGEGRQGRGGWIMKRTWSCWALVGVLVAFGLTYSSVGYAQQVIINEIHYNPLDPTPDPDGTEDAQEFVELHNPGTTAVNIGGWKLSGYSAAGYTFPANTMIAAGGYIVVAHYADQLLAATGYSTPYDWPDGDALSNGGEPVTLLNASSRRGGWAGVRRRCPVAALPGRLGTLARAEEPRAGQQRRRRRGARPSAPMGPRALATARTVRRRRSPPRIPPNGAVVPTLTQIAVTFNESVTDVSADDLTVNGVPASELHGQRRRPVRLHRHGPARSRS